MTYYGIFSLFPLLLLFMALAGLALQSNEQAREQILNVVVGLLPQGQDQLQQVIAGVIDAKGAAAGIGILVLLWSALGWFQVIDHNVNQIWGVDKPRSFVKGKLFALAMVAAIGGVALASWLATAAIGLLSAYTDIMPGSAGLWQVAVSALSVLTIATTFLVLYRFTPRREIDLADVWPAALTTALLWELTRRIIAFYLAQNNMISGYGPIGAAMALLFWVYVSSIIILLGAEIAYAVAKERRRGPRPLAFDTGGTASVASRHFAHPPRRCVRAVRSPPRASRAVRTRRRAGGERRSWQSCCHRAASSASARSAPHQRSCRPPRFPAYPVGSDPTARPRALCLEPSTYEPSTPPVRDGASIGASMAFRQLPELPVHGVNGHGFNVAGAALASR
jgi:membrane protein